MFVFIPMFFAGELFDLHSLCLCAVTFLAYSFMASSIYCYNDIVDTDADRRHPVKCHRPVASGAVSVRLAYTLMALMAVLSVAVVLLPVFSYLLSGFNLPVVTLLCAPGVFLFRSAAVHLFDDVRHGPAAAGDIGFDFVANFILP